MQWYPNVCAFSFKRLNNTPNAHMSHLKRQKPVEEFGNFSGVISLKFVLQLIFRIYNYQAESDDVRLSLETLGSLLHYKVSFSLLLILIVVFSCYLKFESQKLGKLFLNLIK